MVSVNGIVQSCQVDVPLRNPISEANTHRKGHSMTELKPGDPAPDFTLPASGGQTISLGDFAGKQVVLYLYPRDDTPGCTKEAIGFTEQLDAFAAGNAVILGLSKDTPAKARQVHLEARSQSRIAVRRGRQRHRGLRVLGRKEHVRQEVDGDRALDVPDRTGWCAPENLAQGQGSRAC